MNRRRRPLSKYALIIVIFVIFPFLIIIRSVIFFPASQAKETVDNFYAYEQQGNFSDSWNLFHPFMKQKFTKAAFIQDRSHVFIGHFGVDTFTYTISKAEKFDNWKAREGQSIIKEGYKMIVTQK